VSWGGAVVSNHGAETCGVCGEGEAPVSDLLRLITINRLTSWWWPIPPLVHVAHQLVTPHQDIAWVTVVFDDALELTGSVDELKSSIDDISWHATLQI